MTPGDTQMRDAATHMAEATIMLARKWNEEIAAEEALGGGDIELDLTEHLESLAVTIDLHEGRPSQEDFSSLVDKWIRIIRDEVYGAEAGLQAEPEGGAE